MSVPTFTLGTDLACRRIINGLWQTSGGWGNPNSPADAVSAMASMAQRGYSSFDLADHYGPAEDLIGQLNDRQRGGAAPAFAAFTKWCPSPELMTRAKTVAAVQRSLDRMKTRQLDLLQLHWWDYASMGEAIKALRFLAELRQEGKIREIGLTNFDTARLAEIVEAGIPVVSNQVQFSLVDMRPARKMAPFCERHGIKLLTYGTLCGGLLTDRFLGAPEPRTKADLPTPSMRKYFGGTIQPWGGWPLFQELLRTLRRVADRHPGGVTIATVATRCILDQPAVGGVIIGLRAGVSEHADENAHVFGLQLTPQDRAEIDAVLAKGRDLLALVGDCGDEYRG